MNHRKHIENELNGLNSQLPSSADQGPLKAPEGYFDGLAGSIMSKIRAGANQEPGAADEIYALSPLLASISREMPLSVPPYYFEENIESLPSVTGSADEVSFEGSKTMPFGVPDQYFEQFPQKMLQMVKPAARVIPMHGFNWRKLAVAAMIAVVMGVSGFWYFSKDKTQPAGSAPSIAADLKALPTRELDEFIKTMNINTAGKETAQHTKGETSDVKKLLNDVSASDLDAFLKQVPNEDDLAIN